MTCHSVGPRMLGACGRAAAILALVVPLVQPNLVQAQEDRRPMVAGVFDANAVRSLIARGDAAAAAWCKAGLVCPCCTACCRRSVFRA